MVFFREKQADDNFVDEVITFMECTGGLAFTCERQFAGAMYFLDGHLDKTSKRSSLLGVCSDDKKGLHHFNSVYT